MAGSLVVCLLLNISYAVTLLFLMLLRETSAQDPSVQTPTKSDEKTVFFLCGSSETVPQTKSVVTNFAMDQGPPGAQREDLFPSQEPFPPPLSQPPELPKPSSLEYVALNGFIDPPPRPTIENYVEAKFGTVGTIQLTQGQKMPAPKGLRCRLIISACSSCVIRVRTSRQPEGIQCQPCRDPNDCFELSFGEHGYNRSRRSACECSQRELNSATFRTQSYKLQINYVRPPDRPSLANTRTTGQDFADLFPLTFEVLDNTVLRHGSPLSVEGEPAVPAGTIESPNYPEPYRQGVSINYTLINDDKNGSIRLTFLDFQLHFMSSLVIYDTNNNKLVNTLGKYGTTGRPLPVQSSGPVLYVLFQANHYVHEIGFRAQYAFVKGLYWPDRPTEDCDKTFHDKGGVIDIPTLGLPIGYNFDCVWIVEKSRYTLPLYDQLFLKVHDFYVGTSGKPVQLEIRRGRTSISPEEVDLFGPLSKEALARMQPAEGFTTSLSGPEDPTDANDGFYMRLTGYIGTPEGLKITFAQFYRWATAMCSEPNDFHCNNGRCIRYGRCDGHDHCGDYSDEERCSEIRPRGTSPPVLADLAMGSSSLGSYTMTIILVAGLIGLTLVMLMVTVVVARIYRQRLIRRLTHDRPTVSTIEVCTAGDSSTDSAPGNAMIGGGPAAQAHRVGDRRFFIFPDPDVPVFEAPPTYDDALKHPQVPPNSNGGSGVPETPSSSTSLTSSLASSRRSAMIPPHVGSVQGPLAPSRAFDNPGFAADQTYEVPRQLLIHGLSPMPLPILNGADDTDSDAPLALSPVLPGRGASPNFCSAVQTDGGDTSSESSSSSSGSDCDSQCSSAPSTHDLPHSSSTSGGGGLMPANPLGGLISWARSKVVGNGADHHRRGSHGNGASSGPIVTPISVGVDLRSSITTTGHYENRPSTSAGGVPVFKPRSVVTNRNRPAETQAAPDMLQRPATLPFEDAAVNEAEIPRLRIRRADAPLMDAQQRTSPRSHQISSRQSRESLEMSPTTPDSRPNSDVPLISPSHSPLEPGPVPLSRRSLPPIPQPRQSLAASATNRSQNVPKNETHCEASSAAIATRQALTETTDDDTKV